jgi:flagellar protein FliS
LNKKLTDEQLYKMTPQELTMILYKVLEESLIQARLAIETKNYQVANQQLQKSNDILTRLGAGINYEAGIIADQLESLYRYLFDLAIQTNLRKDINQVNEMIRIVRILSEAWDTAMNNGKATVKVLRDLRKKAYDMSIEENFLDIKE